MSSKRKYEIWLTDNHPDAVEYNEFLTTREPTYEFSNGIYDEAERFSKEEAEKIRKEILNDLDEDDKEYIDIAIIDTTPFKYKKSVKTESTNKYIRAFRESCKKLEEDDGNPSLFQALDYNIDNEELNTEDMWTISEYIEKALNLLSILIKEYPTNKKISKIYKDLKNVITYWRTEAFKDLTDNRYVSPGEHFFDSGEIVPAYDLQNTDYK